MGRLPLVDSRLRAVRSARRTAASALVLCAGALACDDGKAPSPPQGRAEVVFASPTSKTAPPVASSAVATAHAPAKAPPKPPRKLCEAEWSKPGRALPKVAFDARAAAGATPPDTKLETGGRFTWINFFAAWCGPCKEEIPRLRGWEQKLGASLRVRFISLDDDERQLERFFGDQPPLGLKGALWLKPGATRDTFLDGLRLARGTSLPAHALVDSRGLVRCAFEGAVDDADFAHISSLVKAPL